MQHEDSGGHRHRILRLPAAAGRRGSDPEGPRDQQHRHRHFEHPRECPLSTLHLRNLTAASELGAVIVPPVPAYYQHPKCIDDINGRISAKVLALFGLDTGAIPEWGGLDL